MKKLSYLIMLTVILGLVLTGCTLLSNVGQVPTTGQSGIAYLTKGTEADPDSFLLYAGQHDLVGEVLVWNDDTQLCVKYQLSVDAIAEGWLIYETHVDAATTLEGIPQKNGNPPPGKLRYGDDELPGEEEAGPYCIPFEDIIGFTEELDLCDADIVIAAHAVIEKEDCIPGDSGTDTYVSDATTMVIAGNVVSAVYPYAAVPTDTGAHYGADTWINQTGTGSWVPAPTWIWESNPVVNPILGDIVWFEKTFNVTGTPTAGELKIAVDNGYAVWLNGKFVGSDNLFLFVGADDDYDTTMLGDLTQAYVDTTTWQKVGIFTLTPYLQTGTNTLKILGVNEYMYSDDVTVIPSGSPQPNGTFLLNPGGMAFQFTVDWEVPEVCTTYDETAWGAVSEGNEPFPGNNWATYFNYVPECKCTEQLWQIGTPHGDVGPIDGSAEYPANREYTDEFTYYVGSDADPIGAPLIPGYIGSINVCDIPDVSNRPCTDTTMELNIVFELYCNHAEGELILIYDRYGSETDTLYFDFDGDPFATVFATEGGFKQFSLPLPAAAAETHTITIAYEGGGNANGHYIDYLKLVEAD